MPVSHAGHSNLNLDVVKVREVSLTIYECLTLDIVSSLREYVKNTINFTKERLL